MVTKMALACVLLSASSLMGMCKKEEEKAVPTAEPAPVDTTPVATATAAAASDVGECPSPMVPQGGTVRLLKSFNVYKSPERGADKIGGLSVGTLVDLKGSCGNWMKVMWPSAVATLSPGWIELKTIYDPTVQVTDASAAASATATVAASASALPTATASAVAAAPTTSASGRPRPFRMPILKKTP